MDKQDGNLMADFAVLGATLSVISGAALAILYFWLRRRWKGSLLLFFLPLLAYFLWHFSVEAYGWGELWASAPETTVEMATAIALVDFKLLFAVFLWAM